MHCRRSRRSVIEVGFEAKPDRVVITIGRELRSPNRWRTWRGEFYESKTWERVIAAGLRLPASTLCPWPIGRQKVTVVRKVPSRRNFLKDDDNLGFAIKPAMDSLKRLGWLIDDSRRWLDAVATRQEVSEDKRYWTVITLEPGERSTDEWQERSQRC